MSASDPRSPISSASDKVDGDGDECADAGEDDDQQELDFRIEAFEHNG